MIKVVLDDSMHGDVDLSVFKLVDREIVGKPVRRHDGIGRRVCARHVQGEESSSWPKHPRDALQAARGIEEVIKG